MSSHHIVREHQEPALILWSGLDVVPYETLAGLLEWSPLIIVNAPVLQAAIHRGIKIDIVTGTDSELKSIEKELEEQQPLKTFCLERNEREIILFNDYLMSKGIWQANIILDASSSASLFVNAHIQWVFYTKHFRGVVIAPESQFEKWLIPGENFFTGTKEIISIKFPAASRYDEVKGSSFSTQCTGVHTFYNTALQPVILWQEVK